MSDPLKNGGPGVSDDNRLKVLEYKVKSHEDTLLSLVRKSNGWQKFSFWSHIGIIFTIIASVATLIGFQLNLSKSHSDNLMSFQKQLSNEMITVRKDFDGPVRKLQEDFLSASIATSLYIQKLVTAHQDKQIQWSEWTNRRDKEFKKEFREEVRKMIQDIVEAIIINEREKDRNRDFNISSTN